MNRRKALKEIGVAAVAGFSPVPLHARTDTDVIVIGAGLSGLYAATLLADEGFNVIVLEGRHRIGGRLESFRDIEGNPEAGGDSILGGYGRVRDLASRLGMVLIDHNDRRGLAKPEISLRGKVIPREQWPSHPLNHLPDNAKAAFPGRRFFQKVVEKNNPLDSHEDWIGPESRQLDEPVYSFLKRLGWNERTIEQNYNTNVGRGTSAHDSAMLTWFYRLAWDKVQLSLDRVAIKVKGGNQRLPEAMAASLPNEVHLNKIVVGLRSNKKTAEVHCSDGSIYRGKRVICSTPVPTLRWIKFDPPLSPTQTQGIKVIPSMKITKVVLMHKRPFWEDDGLDPAMWTDTPAGEIQALRQLDGDNRITGLVARARGFGSQRLDIMGEEAAKNLVVSEYEKLRPASKGQLEAVGFKSWALDPFAGGCWSEWMPGQIHNFLLALAQPSGRIHFCGEHTATSNRGMEGATESGERAAFEVMGLI